jgi:hypothetical protein
MDLTIGTYPSKQTLPLFTAKTIFRIFKSDFTEILLLSGNQLHLRCGTGLVLNVSFHQSTTGLLDYI